MKKLFPLGAVVLLLTFSLCLISCSGKQAAEVKANKKVVELVKTWDPKLAFYTSKKNPLKTIEGLKQAEIACFGPELAGNIQAFYDAAQIQREYGNAVQVIGPNNQLFTKKDAPRLYLVNSNYERKLTDFVRVKFSE